MSENGAGPRHDLALREASADDAAPIWEIRPQPGPQEQFLASPADIVIYGGQAGGGKTWGLLLEPLRHIHVRGFGAVIFRRETPQIKNEGGLWDDSFEIYQPLGATPYDGALEWYFPPHQNRVRFAHMEHEKDRFHWQGAQVPFIGFDELTHFTETQFFYMLSRNRSTCGIRPYVRATTNPDADSWVARLIAWWIDQETGYAIPARSGVIRWVARVAGTLVWGATREAVMAQYPRARPKSITFILARLEDNRILMAKDPDYEANLDLLPDVERARLREGNWKVRPSAGRVFNRANLPIYPAPAEAMVVDRVRYWDKAGTDDGGAWTAGVRMAKTADGLYYVEDVVRGQWASQRRDRVMYQTAVMDGRDVPVWVEQEPGSGGKDSADATVRLLAGWVVRAERVTGSKESRAEPYSSQVQGGNVRLVEAAWNHEYIEELQAFPTGRYQDQVDASSGAFNKLEGAVVVGAYNPDEEILDEFPADEIGGHL